MVMLNLTDLANYPGHKYKKMIVRPGETVVSRDEALKFYALFKEGQAPPWEIEKRVRTFLCNEGARHELELGFVILSEHTLNVARWNSAPLTPYFLLNKFYSIIIKNGEIGFEERDIRKVEGFFIFDGFKSAIETFGAFDAFKLAIFGHESAAWRRYFASLGTDDDKRKYLADMIKGEIY